MITLLQATEFGDWLRTLKDNIGKARILARLRSASLGRFGDAKPVGSGVFELRIHAGPGYRFY
jgi:putative addiction module killer protein